MTTMLFNKNSYLKEHQTKVLHIEGNQVSLEETIFFPQSSTEPGDVGKINGNKVIGLKREEERIWHILSKPPTFKQGDTVKLEIDWEKRYKMMKLHSALHLLAGVFDLQFKERAVAGVVKSKSAYLVFKHELPDDVIPKALERANEDIQEGLAIKTYEDDERKGFRWCRVGDYLPIPCGGLHVKGTKEIGELVCKGRIIEAGRQKLTIEVK